MKDKTVKELLDGLEEHQMKFEDALFRFTTGSKDVTMKEVDTNFKAMKPYMKELSRRAKEYNDD
jgi:hypothetical protein